MSMSVTLADTVLVYSTLLLSLSITDKVKADILGVVPPGCTCISPNHETFECAQFDCLCTCDMTGFMCDLNCCCDPDCTNEEVSGFDCIDGYRGLNSELPLCSLSDSKPLSTHGPVHLGGFVEEVVDNLLCIEVDNSATKGTFFREQGIIELPTSEVTISGLKEEDFSSFFDQPTATSNRTGTYHIGDYLQSVYRIGDDNQREITEFVIPSKNDGGLCETNSAVRFASESKSRCGRVINNLEDDCKKTLNTNWYTNKTSILNNKTSRSTLNYITQKSMLIDIVHTTTTYLNGTSTPVVLATEYVSNSTLCQRAVKSVYYIVSISTTGEITNVTADIEVIDISDEIKVVSQDFHVLFRTENSLTMQSKSGNPGYIYGMPVLTGKEINNDVTVEGYLTIFDFNKGGNCLPASTSRRVTFGEDLIIGCSAPLTRNELETLCTTNEHPYLTDDLHIPKWLQQDMTLVGKFGNSNANDRSQWLNIDKPTTGDYFNGKSRKWSSTRNRCDGLISSVKYRILWTHVGSTESPQAKIVSVTLEYDDSHTMQHNLQPREMQTYYFTTIVTWVYLPNETEILKLPPPNLFFSVPQDIFYPFNERSSGEKTIEVRSSFKIRLGVIAIVFFLTA